MKSKKNKLLLWLVLIIVLMAITRYGISSWRKYNGWKTHQSYFEQAPGNRKIENWMTPNFIKRHHNIDFNTVSDVTPGFWEERNPINELCTNHHLDCDALIKKLNAQINK